MSPLQWDISRGVGRGWDTASSGQGPSSSSSSRSASGWRLPLALGNSLEWEPILHSGDNFSSPELTNTCGHQELQGH